MKAHIILAISILSSSCGDKKQDSTWWNNEKTIIELNNQISLNNYKINLLDTDNESVRIEKTVHDIPAINAEISDLIAQNARLGLAITGMKQEWENFRLEILKERRKELVGKTFDSLELSSGKSFTDARITRIDDSGVSLMHSSGTSRLRCSDLDQAERAYFCLDSELAQHALAKERNTRSRYDQWVNEQLAITEKEEAQKALIRRQEELEREQRLASAKALAATSSRGSSLLSDSIGKLGETSRVGSGYSSAYYRRSSPTYYYYENSSAPCYRPPSYPSYGNTTFPVYTPPSSVFPICVPAP
ncbi:hypothetical protein ACFSSA_12530 [Luteolibacter algae]|uniref:Lipoprotein n=2 Tax=Luteolibacter algae TaxID=454151 RepID=A0ABW5D9U6_9BACT